MGLFKKITNSKKHVKKLRVRALAIDALKDQMAALTDDELKLKIKINDGEEELKPQENALSVSASFMEMLHLSSVYKGIAVPSIVFDSTGTKK